MLKFLKWFLGLILLLLIAALAFVYFSTYHPKALEPMPVVSPASAPRLRAGQTLKALSWNIQYLAGKDYIFWYDLPDGSGPDIQPSSQAIAATVEGVARIITQENPDIILLQEVDENARRSYYEDQLKKLLTLLPAAYCCYTEAFYWKAAYVPHPKVQGRVGMKLVVLSKYQMQSAWRHQLALIERKHWYDWVEQQFNLKRALQEVYLPVEGGRELVVGNTHLSAFAQGTNN
ncbi:MAG: endonuclease/exonuclease/phosphatase family protein, partial [Bacteroidia bacterium]|nr:endonuclease/exonuclease/phosphatase family protein [Bacteroidia bacterium]